MFLLMLEYYRNRLEEIIRRRWRILLVLVCVCVGLVLFDAVYVSTEELIDELVTRNSSNWTKTIDSLVTQGDEVVEPLTAILVNGSDTVTGRGAAEVLGRIGDRRAIGPMVSILNSPDSNRWLRESLIESLAMFQESDEAIEAITNRLGDPDRYVKERAVSVLIAIDRISVADLLTSLETMELDGWENQIINGDTGEVHRTVVCEISDALVVKGISAVGPAIAKLEDRNKPDLQILLARTLGQIGASSATDALIAASKNTDEPDVQKAMIEALGTIGDDRCIPFLEGELAKYPNCETVAEALDKMGWQPKTLPNTIHYYVAKKNNAILHEGWELAQSVLLDDLDSGIRATEHNAFRAWIAVGREDSIEDLKDALMKHGDRDMAQTFLDTGNKELMEIAKTWASKNGYMIWESSDDRTRDRAHWGTWK